jgi:Site-specific recombinase XerD
MIDQFLDYIRYERNLSPQTVLTYERFLRDFESYFKSLDETLTWTTIDTDIVRDWLAAMLDKGAKATSVNTALSAVRSFFRFALARRLVEKDPAHLVTGPKKSKPLPQFVREKEMDELFDEIAWEDTFKDVRARTLLILLYETGVRVSELTGLDDADVDFETGQLKVTGKRNKQRVVPFGSELATVLRQYVELRDAQVAKQSGALLLTEKGTRMTRGQVYGIVHRYLSMVTTLKKRSPHVLRHSFATAMLNNGAGLESVKKLLGHESLETTEIYTHTTFEQLKRVYKEAHPRA